MGPVFAEENKLTDEEFVTKRAKTCQVIIVFLLNIDSGHFYIQKPLRMIQHQSVGC